MMQKIKDQIKEAMLAKDTVRLSVLRGLSTLFTNELIATKRSPDDKLTDEEVLALIRRSVKQRKDSIEQFKKGNREDLAKAEETELKILEAYLPQMMSEEEVKKVVDQKKSELKIEDKTKMGMLMSAVMKELKGKADGALVKKIVEGLFS